MRGILRVYLSVKGSGTLKKTSLSIILFLLFTMFGILIGVQMEALGKIENSTEFPFNSGGEVQEIADLRKATEDMKLRIKELSTQIEAYEEERATENIVLKDLKTKVDEYRMLAGNQTVVGPGIKITLESVFEENIAALVEQKKYLINLINELKMSQAEVISINDHRITSRTEVTLAGNHINVNSTSIAPPYIISAIGNVEEFERYVTYRTLLFDLMKKDGINVNIQYQEEIEIPAITKEKPIQFLRINENSN